MTTNDEEFYQLSKFLLDSAEQNPLITFKDCSVRTSISRAFYFIYHKLITLIGTHLKIDIQEYAKKYRQGTHITIVRVLEENGFESMAYGYNRLRDYRTKADYKLKSNLPNHIAETCIEMAEDIADEVDDWLEKIGHFKK
ncbi:Uncharacterised protein [Acinetobacter junii]|uniref:hypothetical protein n=1 Tax=Acinetobacter junii TaxID=40215 RepID=UPI0019583301|nr:hypothetical protein [Acinetobacter junii]VTX91394.1 Uncharacterised protein [Acinetobacter junii]